MFDKNQLKNIFHKTKVEVDVLLAYDGSDNLEYVGFAQAGSASSANVWSIRKLAYSGSNLVSVKYADGSADFNKVWDSRAGYSY